MNLPKPVIEIEDKEDAKQQFAFLYNNTTSKTLIKIRDREVQESDNPFLNTLVDYILIKKVHTPDEKIIYNITRFGVDFIPLIENNTTPRQFVASWYNSAKLVALCRKIYEKRIKDIEITLKDIYTEKVFITKKELISEGFTPYLVGYQYSGSGLKVKVEGNQLLIRVGRAGDINSYFLPYELLMKLLSSFSYDTQSEIIKKLDKLSCNQFRLLTLMNMKKGFFSKEGLPKKTLEPFFKGLRVGNKIGYEKLLKGLFDLKLVLRHKTKKQQLCLLPLKEAGSYFIPLSKVLRVIDNFYKKHSKPITSIELEKYFPDFAPSTVRRAVSKLEANNNVWILRSSRKGVAPWRIIAKCENPLEGFPFRHQRVLLHSSYYHLYTYLSLADLNGEATAREIAENASLNFYTVKAKYLTFLRKHNLVKLIGATTASRYNLLNFEDYLFARYYTNVVLEAYDKCYKCEKDKIKSKKGGVIQSWLILEKARRELAKISNKGEKLFALEPIILLLKERAAKKDRPLLERYKKLRKGEDKEHLKELKRVLTKTVLNTKNRETFLSNLLLEVVGGRAGAMEQTYIRLEMVKDKLPEGIQETLNKIEAPKK